MMNESTSLADMPAVSQKHLGSKGLIIFLALLSAFVPLSTDLYLPALPTITGYFHIHEYQTNLTLILFFVFYAIGTLVWGPLSDKYGRRPMLLIGLAGYMVASLLCAVSFNIYQLIIFRVLQAAGGSVSAAMSTAIVKDTYQGRKCESILAIVQMMVVFAPAIAPILGAFLLNFTSWRGIFGAQVVLGIAALLGAFAFQETLTARNYGYITQTLGRLAVVLKNPGFSHLLIIFSLTAVNLLAFISCSSYIYQDIFGLGSQTYSFYFAFNGAGLLFGPYIYIKLSARFKRFSIINGCFVVTIISGILVLTLGRLAPWIFAITVIPATFVCGCTRPPSTFLMLEQQKGDTGSASSLINSSFTIMGSLGMVIVSFAPGSLISVIGALNLAVGVLCITLWLGFTKKPFLSKVREI
jgi:DHA1 family bicyclomycin/chloramphenicol resistance-like MFS transporter